MSFVASRTGAVLAALAIAICLPSCGGEASDSHNRPTSANQPLVTGEPAPHHPQDEAFANGIIQNHKQGIDLSRLVTDHSTDARVVSFAAARSTVLQSDVQVLKVMLVQWNDSADSSTGTGGGATASKGMLDGATVAKLGSLRGGQFDTLWLQSMIGLDQGAVDMANAEINGDNHNDDVVGLARQIIAARQADIATMRRLLGS